MQWKVARAILSDGASNEVAARRLFVAEDTIKTHVKTIYQRAKVATRLELAIQVWSGQLDLINPAGLSLRTELEVVLQSTAA